MKYFFIKCIKSLHINNLNYIVSCFTLYPVLHCKMISRCEKSLVHMCYLHTQIKGGCVSRIPEGVFEILTMVYEYSIPEWEYCVEFVRILYVIIDGHWSQGEWEEHRIELELEDKPDFSITQDDLCEELQDITTTFAEMIFQEENLTKEINDKNLKIGTEWIVGMDKLTLIFSMKQKNE